MVDGSSSAAAAEGRFKNPETGLTEYFILTESREKSSVKTSYKAIPAMMRNSRKKKRNHSRAEKKEAKQRKKKKKFGADAES